MRYTRYPHSFPTRRSSDLRFEHWNNAADDRGSNNPVADGKGALQSDHRPIVCRGRKEIDRADKTEGEGQNPNRHPDARSEEHTSELQSHSDLVCRLLLEKK